MSFDPSFVKVKWSFIANYTTLSQDNEIHFTEDDTRHVVETSSLSTQVLFSTTLSRTIIFHSWAQPILLGYNIRHKGKSAHEPRTQAAGAYPAFVSMKHAKEYCYSPLYGMLVHRRVTPQQYVASTHLYT